MIERRGQNAISLNIEFILFVRTMIYEISNFKHD